MRVLVTGASGMLGGDVAVAAQDLGHEVTAPDRASLDITEASEVADFVREANPDAVINCAAWTDVDGAEAHEAEATEINALGAGNLSAAAETVEASICQVSTDYVFDGEKDGPYVESDATSPIQAYGRSKLAGELAVVEKNPKHFVVRSSWLFGTRNDRPNFVETMLGIGSSADPVAVVTDQVGCPTYTGHLALGLVELIDGTDYGVRHMAGSGSCTWFEFAQEIFRQAGMEVEVTPTTAEEFARPAPRPANSTLASEWNTPVMLPDWKEGLGEYLRHRDDSRERESGR